MASGESPGIKLKYKKQRSSTNFDKCIKCQTVKKGVKLQDGQQASIEKFIRCGRSRDDEVYQRLKPDIEGTVFCEQVKWHKACYSSYTSTINIGHASKTYDEPFIEEQPSASIPRRRSTESKTDWALCIFCQKIKYRGEKVSHKL
jgi:hypothetical protein